MLELGFEYILSYIDYCILLYFYLLIVNEKWNWRKAIPYIAVISCIQLFKDESIDFGGWSIFIDVMIVTGFLFIYGKKHKLQNLICAMLIYSVFHCCVVVFVGTAIELKIDVAKTLVFSYQRLIFAFFLKLFIIMMLCILLHPLKKLNDILSLKTMRILLFIIIFIMMSVSFVYGNSVGNQSILIYMLFTLVLFVFILYLLYHYSITLKENEQLNLINQSKELTAQYTKKFEQEHEQVKKIRHDMKNQLYVLSKLQKDKRYSEVEHMLSTLTHELESNRASISGNIYVDAIFRQKQEEFKNIRFDLSVILSQDFSMGETDLISLLSNIIDNACEELIRINKNEFCLSIKANKTTLQIHEVNDCRTNLELKTDKNEKYHGYGLKIIKEIVDKYDGEMQIEMNDQFHLDILLLL